MTTLDDIRAAARRLEGRVLLTPLRHSPWLSAESGASVLLKLECLQPSFSFKIRGALNAVLRLAEASSGDLPPLVTASAGNHGRALALAARESGLRLTVYVPESAPRVKLDAIRAEGAELVACRDYDEAERRAKEHAAAGRAVFVSPYSHPDVVAGAGTITLEILAERRDIDTLVVPMGGGGLIGGIGIAAHGSGAAVIGVEVEASCPFTQSLAAGRIVPIEVGRTLADGLAGNLDPDTITFDLVRRFVERIVVISEGPLRAAVGDLVREERLIVEGGGAVGVAALRSGALELAGQQVAIVLTGANIDPETLRELL